jgi:hypothetical protein
VEDAATVALLPRLVRDRGALSALAFALPWVAVGVLLPAPQRYASLALTGALALLLVAAARWSWRRAAERGLDAEKWAFLATVTFGLSMLPLALPAPLAESRSVHDGVPCADCGRVQLPDEPFCFACGAQ